MLEKLDLYDFQAHTHLTVGISPTVTCITGPTDVGKSSVVRALRTLFLNDVRGNEFVRWGSDRFTVAVTIDGKRVKRSKGEGVNEYRVGKAVYKSFKTSVPDEVAKLLSVGEDNFQMQLDQPYWLTLAPGQVAKNLNRIVNLDLIDRSLSNLNSELRKAKVAVELADERYTKARDTVAGLKWVEQAGEEWERVETLQGKWESCDLARLDLESLYSDAVGVQKKKDSLSEELREGSELLSIATETFDLNQPIAELERLIESVNSLSDVPEETPDLSRVERLRGNGDRLAERRRKLEELVEGVRDAQGRIEATRYELGDAEMELQSKLQGRCPLCRKKL